MEFFWKPKGSKILAFEHHREFLLVSWASSDPMLNPYVIMRRFCGDDGV